MDQDPSTPVSLHYMIQHLNSLMEDQRIMQKGDYSHQLLAEQTLKHTKNLLGQFALDLDWYGYQMNELLEGHRFEEVDTRPLRAADRIPMEGVPYNIPGGVHSENLTPTREWVDRDILYHMSNGEPGN